ncbi:unnamed protein product, partial [Discosporangium mesarthrocarpum]
HGSPSSIGSVIMSSPPRRRRRVGDLDSPASDIPNAPESSGTGARARIRRNGGERRRIGLAEDEDIDDGMLSDPPPMEYNASRDGEIDEDPDHSDGGEGGGRDEEEEGEDIMDMDRIDADYVAIPELDRYDAADLDRRDYQPMDHAQRREAERELDERDMLRAGRISGILDHFGSEDEEDRGKRRAQLGLREAARGEGDGV